MDEVLVTVNDVTCLLNFMKICQLVQKLIVGAETDRQTDSTLISRASLPFLKESLLIK
jgi:hypothetical protein